LYYYLLLFAFGLEIGGIEISLEILDTWIGDLVIAALDSSDKSVVDEFGETTVDLFSTFVNILSYNGRRKDEFRRLEDFKNTLVSRQLHPFTGFSHRVVVPE